MAERPIDPPEGEFEPIHISDQDLLDRAKEKLEERLEKGGFCDLANEITTTCNDLSEFEANLWAYLQENDKAIKYICRKYVFANSKELQEEIQEAHIAEMVNLRDNPESI